MAFADGATGPLWYQLEGEGEVVVLTGGWGLTDKQFESVTPLLAERYCVLNWSWRGIGRSHRDVPGPQSLEDWADDLATVLDHAGVERAYLWGTSSGGMVSLLYAAHRPEQVAGVATWVQLYANEEFQRAFALFPEVIAVFGWDGLAILLSWLGLGSDVLLSERGVEFARWERVVLAENLEAEALAAVCAAVAQADVRPVLGSVRAPVTALAGTDGSLGLEGDYCAPALAELLRHLPHATVSPVAGASGTYFLAERPAESVAVFTAWVDSLRGSLGA